MSLSKNQEAAINKLRTAGGDKLAAVGLDDEVLAYLVGVVARDIGVLGEFPELAGDLPAFFGAEPQTLRAQGVQFKAMFERLVQLRKDADTYFYCLGTLHKARLKYERILESQPTPNIDQVGPRGLLQYGKFSDRALTAFLFWRKWISDIDNRAGQETGYVFEPIVANAIGGVPYSPKKSPVRRGGNGEGRQTDCIREGKAYEIKLRVTIAASGQGRWRQEIEFPEDCKASGYVPVLVVFDPTPNAKLEELQRAFLGAGGEVYVGSEAWRHLEQSAGDTMAVFLEKYVRQPIQTLLEAAPGVDQLPEIRWVMDLERVEVSVLGETLIVNRVAGGEDDDEESPEDVDEHIITP